MARPRRSFGRLWGPLALLVGLSGGLGAGFRPAHAQIPALPEVEGPALRLAGKDPVEDALSALLARVEPELAARRSASRALGPAPEPDGETVPDPEAARAREALEEEIEHLARAAEKAQDGLALLSVAVPDRIPSSFAELWEAQERVLQLEALSEQREARARRLRSLTAGQGTRTATTAAAARLIEQLDRVQRAEAEAASADALRTQVELRKQRARVEARRVGLSVSPEEVTRAQEAQRAATAEVELAQIELTKQRGRLQQAIMREGDGARGDLRRAARRIRIEVLVRAVENAKARRSKASIELTAVKALAEGREPDYPPELGIDAVAAARAEVAEARVEAEARSSELRARLRDAEPAEARLLRQIRDRLEDVLASLAEEAEVLGEAEALIRLVGRPSEGARSPEAWATAIGLTGVVVLLLTLFFLRVWPALQAVERRRTEKRPKALATRLMVAVDLVLPVLLVLGAAAIVIWPIWQLPVGLGEVMDFLETPLFYVDQEPISALSLVKLVGTIWLTILLSRATRGLVIDRTLRRLSVETGVAHTFGTLLHYGFLVVGFTVGLRFVGVGLSSFALLAGVLGIGVGFGLRNVTENFISGLIVLFERPIKAGDWITLENGLEAQVIRIRARSTTVRSRDFVSIIIPNSEFVAKHVTNWSHGERRVRLGVEVGVAYGSDTDRVRKSLLGVAERDGRVLKHPPPEVHFRDFGSSSLDFTLYVWIASSTMRPRIESDLRFAIDSAFRKASITIAFPQLDLHLASVASGVRLGSEAAEPPPVQRSPARREPSRPKGEGTSAE